MSGPRSINTNIVKHSKTMMSNQLTTSAASLAVNFFQNFLNISRNFIFIAHQRVQHPLFDYLYFHMREASQRGNTSDIRQRLCLEIRSILWFVHRDRPLATRQHNMWGWCSERRRKSGYRPALAPSQTYHILS